MRNTVADDHGDPALWYVHRNDGRTEPLRRRIWRRRVPIVFLGSLLVGLLVTAIGGWRYGAGFEVGASIGLLVISVNAIPMLRRRDPRLGRRALNMSRHRWLWLPVLVILAGYSMARATLYVGDWLVPADRFVVTIERELLAPRYHDEFKTDHGYLSTPAFIDLRAKPGPAIVSIGHFSGQLLRIEPSPGS